MLPLLILPGRLLLPLGTEPELMLVVTVLLLLVVLVLWLYVHALAWLVVPPVAASTSRLCV